MKRMGMRHRPTYRIVVTDARRSRDGEYIESLGHYDPRTKLLEVDLERAKHWLSHGAQPTDTAGKLIRRYERQQTEPRKPEPEKSPTEIAAEAAAEAGIMPAPPDQAAEQADEAEAPAEMAAANASEPDEKLPSTETEAEEANTETETPVEGGQGERAD
jgi:small subunit ribosomal protein S16